MPHILWVFLGGGLGSVLRYGTTVTAARLFGASFPWGTLIVNLAGCLLAGLVAGWAERQDFLTAGARVFILIGLLGGLTTFSTYGLESYQAGRAGEYGVMFLHMLAHNVAGWLFVAAGFWAARAH